jgi:hypothetical protein
MPTGSWMASLPDVVQYPDGITTRYRTNWRNHHLPGEMFGIARLMKRYQRQENTISMLGPTLDVYISQEALVWLSGSRTSAKLTNIGASHVLSSQSRFCGCKVAAILIWIIRRRSRGSHTAMSEVLLGMCLLQHPCAEHCRPYRLWSVHVMLYYHNMI